MKPHLVLLDIPAPQIETVLRDLAPAEHELLVIEAELLDEVFFVWCRLEVGRHRFPIFGVDVPGDKHWDVSVRAFTAPFHRS